jgi:hypothetical protein
MSYAEYLRRKADTSQKVIDYQPRKVDASQFIMQQRLQASTLFALSGREGVINNVSDPSNTGTTSNPKAAQSVMKVSGGRVPDASTFTAYLGGNAIDEDLKGGARNTKYILPANLPSELCTNSFLNGPAAPKSAGDWVRLQAPCVNNREPHDANELGPALFVDTTNTIKNYNLPQNKTTYQISQDCLQCGNNKTISGTTCSFCVGANHTHPADVPHNTRWAARPLHGMGGIPVSTVPSPSDARKVGDRNPRNLAYVEKHHGSGLTTTFPRVPRKYQIPGQPPAQLKINDPRHYPVS